MRHQSGIYWGIFICVYICVCIDVYVYICLYTFVCFYAYLYVKWRQTLRNLYMRHQSGIYWGIFIYVYIYMYQCVCICVQIYIYTVWGRTFQEPFYETSIWYILIIDIN
jgi:hypothetical protein